MGVVGKQLKKTKNQNIQAIQEVNSIWNTLGNMFSAQLAVLGKNRPCQKNRQLQKSFLKG